MRLRSRQGKVARGLLAHVSASRVVRAAHTWRGPPDSSECRQTASVTRVCLYRSRESELSPLGPRLSLSLSLSLLRRPSGSPKWRGVVYVRARDPRYNSCGRRRVRRERGGENDVGGQGGGGGEEGGRAMPKFRGGETRTERAASVPAAPAPRHPNIYPCNVLRNIPLS
jgi:hypothetical protein